VQQNEFHLGFGHGVFLKLRPLWILLAFLSFGLSHATASPVERPNLLLITVDDMNADSVGVFGSKVPGTTPNIDRLAKEGFRFSHAHVQTASCVPSRNVMWSGRYPHNNGITGFELLQNPDYPVLFDLMRDAGYFTGVFQKAHHSTPYVPYPWDLVLSLLPDGSKLPGRDPKFYGEVTAKGIQAAQAAGKPFCLLLNISDPHHHRVSPEVERQPDRKAKPPSRIFKAEEISVPGFLPDDPVVREEVAEYFSLVRRADDSVGYALRALEEAGVADNTLVVFLSDHGMPFPFAKTQLYHHSTRTPLIIRWPGIAKKDSTDDTHMVSAVDLLPTLLDAIGIPHPKGIDGHSFLPLLKGQAQDGREAVFKQFTKTVNGIALRMRAIETKRFLLIYNHWSDGKRKVGTTTIRTETYKRMRELAKTDPAVAARLEFFRHRVIDEFYDVENDPDCLINLIADPAYQKPLNRLRAALRGSMKETGDSLLKYIRSESGLAAPKRPLRKTATRPDRDS
jgi:N-sulfoglucosamine sulfohydrolase